MSGTEPQSRSGETRATLTRNEGNRESLTAGILVIITLRLITVTLLSVVEIQEPGGFLSRIAAAIMAWASQITA